MQPDGPVRGVMPRLVGACLIVLGVLPGCGGNPQSHPHVAAPAGQWISLFNGKDLNDWTVKIAGHEVNDNYRNTFRVEDGLLKVSYSQYDSFGGRFAALFYNKPFSHYWLRVQYRFVGDKVSGAPLWAYKNSGIFLLAQNPQSMRKDQSFPVCVEFDLVGGHMLGSRPTGDVCQNGTRVKVGAAPLSEQCSKVSDITIRDDQWVTAEAEVSGGTIKQIVNGALIVEYADIQLDSTNPDARKLVGSGGAAALTSGYIAIQGNGHPIDFRRIEILPLADK
jgi:3-keto-disaccharide hydrolase